MLYLLTGDELGANTAMRFCLAPEVVEPGEQLERAVEIAELGLVQRRLLFSEDAAEGVRSFRARRAAVFKGR